MTIHIRSYPEQMYKYLDR